MDLKNYKQKNIFILIIYLIISILLWDTFIIYPFKLFVVMLHEMSHGLMAILFGGSIVNIQIDKAIGGYCRYTFNGGDFAKFFIASAGYLGSLFWGGVILITSAKIKKDNIISLIIGVITLILSYFVIKTGEIFGIIFTLSFAVLMILSFFFIRGDFHDYFHKFLGVLSCTYAIADIKEDLIDRSNIGSDADVIAGITGIPSVVIGIIWGVISLIFLFFVLKFILKLKEVN